MSCSLCASSGKLARTLTAALQGAKVGLFITGKMVGEGEK